MSGRTLEAPEDIPHRVLEEAAAWFANLADAGADPDEQRRWQDWLAAHPDHARAWQRVEEISGQFAPLARAGKVTRDALEGSRRRGRRVVVKTLGLLLLMGGAGMLASRAPWREWRHQLALQRAQYRTGPGEVVSLALEDGGKAWLGSRSALDIAYGARARRLALHQGDLLVQTAADSASPARPFLVDTLHAGLQALGTRFSVRTGEADSRVDVFEGTVRVTLAQAVDAVHLVKAGEHAVFDHARVKSTGPADPARDAWARGILLADGMRLDALAAELANWYARPIQCAPEVAGLRVVGAFPLKDIDRIFAGLEASLPVRLVREGAAARIVPAPQPPSPVEVTPPRRLEPAD